MEKANDLSYCFDRFFFLSFKFQYLLRIEQVKKKRVANLFWNNYVIVIIFESKINIYAWKDLFIELDEKNQEQFQTRFSSAIVFDSKRHVINILVPKQ